MTSSGEPKANRVWALAVLLPIAVACSAASDYDEFRVKREAVFEFAQKPVVTRQGDRVTIEFETKGFCDVTVAIEEGTVPFSRREKGTVPLAAGLGNGDRHLATARSQSPFPRIVRHLASGVLGANAPAPFEKNAKRQTIVWDGKTDQGVYVDDKDKCTVRVSLGLKPQFERTLLWSPKKRITPGNRALFVAAPEGVYAFEGGGVDHIRLFTHEGEYVRTVYPFPPDYSSPEARSGPRALQAALAKVKGLRWAEFPQDGRWLPLWHGVVQATLFNSGSNISDHTTGKYGCAASALALHKDRLALVMYRLNRMATDGTTGGLSLEGPKTGFSGISRGIGEPGRGVGISPRSVAFSPDGKWLYLTGYRSGGVWLQGVARMAYAGDKPAEVFLGTMDQSRGGDDNAHFRYPGSVACDAQGRVYVADYMNDRIQVFSPDAEYLKTIAADKPLDIFVDPKRGDLWVGSWMLVNRLSKAEIPATLTHHGPFDNPKPIATYPLAFVGYNPNVSWNRTGGVQHGMFIDFHIDPPTVWLVPGTGDTTEKLLQLRADYSPTQYGRSPWMGMHYQLYQPKDGTLVKTVDFADDVAKAVVRVKPPQAPAGDRQRMYVEPASGDLYVAEGDSGVGKSFRELLKIDPQTGRVQIVSLPFTTEDMGFDVDGHVYLRTDRQVSRFIMAGWREVPYDYGGEWARPGFDGDGPVLSGALPMPGSGRPGCFHLGGFGVSPGGRIVVSCYNIKALEVRIPGAFGAAFEAGRPYTPQLYPGRLRWGEVHVWDNYGRILYEDAVRGLPMTDGLALDKDDNIYVLVAANRVLNGEKYLLERAQTLMKFPPKKGTIISTSKGALLAYERDESDTEPFDIANGSWVQGADWMYGGVGFGGFQSSKGGGGCACWNARPALDLYARSFVTELNRFCVAVLDTNGNLIMRIGKYGNVDNGVPLIKAGGPANPRPVGGDEVALCHPSYVATHSDRRLFIADYGNYRILSVKLDYYATEKIALKDVQETKP